MAVTAFVLSLVSLVALPVTGFSILAAPVGAGLGHAARRRCRETGEGGRGLALAAVIIGWVGTALLVLGIALVVWLIVAFGSNDHGG